MIDGIGAETSWKLELDPETFYTVSVAAVDSQGEQSEWSPSITVIALSEEQPPKSLPSFDQYCKEVDPNILRD